jgi:hypothetical protein
MACGLDPGLPADSGRRSALSAGKRTIPWPARHPGWGGAAAAAAWQAPPPSPVATLRSSVHSPGPAQTAPPTPCAGPCPRACAGPRAAPCPGPGREAKAGAPCWSCCSPHPGHCGQQAPGPRPSPEQSLPAGRFRTRHSFQSARSSAGPGGQACQADRTRCRRARAAGHGGSGEQAGGGAGVARRVRRAGGARPGPWLGRLDGPRPHGLNNSSVCRPAGPGPRGRGLR